VRPSEAKKALKKTGKMVIVFSSGIEVANAQQSGLGG